MTFVPYLLNILNLELSKECSKTLGRGWNFPEHGWAAETDAWRNRGAAAKMDAIRQKHAAEVDAVEDQQFCTKSCQAHARLLT